MTFNKNTRVKIPATLHLCRLDYQHISLKKPRWDESTNIFTSIFIKSIQRINSDLDKSDALQVLDEISFCLENGYLGRALYEKQMNHSGAKLVDFDNFTNNSLHLLTELLYMNDDEEFRPDTTLLINVFLLVFIKVKKNNYKDGILGKHKCIENRFKNKKCCKFTNITQLMVLSNNMEYDNNSIQPIEAAFYTTASYQKPIFNYFREEEGFEMSKLLTNEDNTLETILLQDTNYLSILSCDANNHLKLINIKESLENNVGTTNPLNIASDDVLFALLKVSESKMMLADQLKNILQQTREMLDGNFASGDPVFISQREELRHL